MIRRDLASGRRTLNFQSIEARWDPSGVPGLAAAVFEGGRPGTLHFAGADCHVDGSLVEPGTVFDAASLTKPLIAWYVLQLAATGEIELDAPMLPTPAVGAAPDARLDLLTPAMALSHCTGFPNWRPQDSPLRLTATPGERVIYSGEGFEYLLAWLRSTLGAARVDADLDVLPRTLGMPHSSLVDHTAPSAGRAARGHTASLTIVDPAPRPVARAAGSLHTTVADYAAFLSSCFWERVRSETSRQIREWMGRPQVTRQDRGRTLGWGWCMSNRGPLVWQHGDNPGFKHIVVVAPDSGDGVVLLTNADSGLELVRWVAAEAGLPTRFHGGAS